MRIALEICVDDAAGLTAARDGGADRVELCAALALGGLTPSPGMMRLAAQAGLPAMAMIRPRAGDFVWFPAEVRVMADDIAAARAAGLAGVVIGASLPDGRLDVGVLALLMQAAKDMDVTLHRAVDLCPDPVQAMRTCVDLGIRRVLSSGGATSAAAGLARLRAMIGHGVTVMPGGGVTAQTIGALAGLPLTEVHASASVPAPEPTDARLAAFGFQPPGARQTDAARVAALRAALDHMPPG
ncbi:copper homeostasis protein CutC [Falsirhodobacter halotolerans]|uniref:copper homeostasis protein CutC n=1 Tax=Falsirhodobacter halotolerans TaxID=1146892 RepID=UPI001FD4E00E|nr:copper homeostasis protein CutC [Falsirhodobacter halotolerans]MCJ8141273.1 copper homeostasis protein CutC [Falsirhodobacter halotolerans]